MTTHLYSDRRERGYNIVEVLIAMALLGVVMTSIVTLFYMGRRNVYSGKQMTKALSVGTRIEEDLSAMTQDDVLTFFNLTSTAAPTASASIAGTTYPDCEVRDTANISGTTDPGGYLDKWSKLLPAADIANPKISLVFMPRSVTRTVAGGSTTFPETVVSFPTAPLLRIRIAIEWKEGVRSRSIILDNGKSKRI
jgi:prepilin-type N-terminal cleavage/methylation domain-containing protein